MGSGIGDLGPGEFAAEMEFLAWRTWQTIPEALARKEGVQVQARRAGQQIDVPGR
jgi:hypothetical protein